MPSTPADVVDKSLTEIERQSEWVRRMVERPSAQLLWRPEPGKWSMAEHVDHLNLTNGAYLDSLEACLAAARGEGILGEGPYRRSWFGNFFVNTLEPPVKMKVKTFKQLTPPANLDPADVARRFLEGQERFARVVGSARGVDLGRARFRSPLFALIKFDAAVGFDILLSHNRRHFWLCERLMEREGFPAA